MGDLNIMLLRETISSAFPRLWPVVDCALATCGTLFLEDNTNPAAVILVGPPSAGKNTVIDMFTNHALTYRSDKFSSAAFVSNSANVSKETLAHIDLLPRIQHKMLLTQELAPIFRGKEEELLDRFNTLTRVLDGRGLMTDSGTHGPRGYEGDYLFAWLGGTTPLDKKAWEVMGKLGSRLLFYRMPSTCDSTPEDLVRSTEETPYLKTTEIGKKVVHAFLTALSTHCGGIRGVKWNSTNNDRNSIAWIAVFARLLAILRTPLIPDDTNQISTQHWENPRRAMSCLYNLARGHALVHGRQGVNSEDLPLIAGVVLSSIPERISHFLQALIIKGGVLTVTQAEEILGGLTKGTARSFLEKLGKFPVMEFVKEGQGKRDYLQLSKDWAWLSSDEYAGKLLGGMEWASLEPVKI